MDVPSVELSAEEFAQDARVSTMLVKSGLCKSQSDARKQIEQNAVSVNDQKINNPNASLDIDLFNDGSVMIRKGKKGFCRIIVK